MCESALATTSRVFRTTCSRWPIAMRPVLFCELLPGIDGVLLVVLGEELARFTAGARALAVALRARDRPHFRATYGEMIGHGVEPVIERLLGAGLHHVRTTKQPACQ